MIQPFSIRDSFPSWPTNDNQANTSGFWVQLVASSMYPIANGQMVKGWVGQLVQPWYGGQFAPNNALTNQQYATAIGPCFEANPPAVASAVAIVNPGINYNYGDTITLAGGTLTDPTDLMNATATILTVVSAQGGLLAVDIIQPGTYQTAPTSPVTQASTSGNGSGATFTMSYSTPGAANTSQPGDCVFVRPSVQDSQQSQNHGLEYVFNPANRSAMSILPVRGIIWPDTKINNPTSPTFYTVASFGLGQFGVYQLETELYMIVNSQTLSDYVQFNFTDALGGVIPDPTGAGQAQGVAATIQVVNQDCQQITHSTCILNVTTQAQLTVTLKLAASFSIGMSKMYLLEGAAYSRSHWIKIG